jgi:hypothetical protein
MNTEWHKKALRESLESIKESVQKGLEERQRTIGFHCSAAAADMLEIFLHEQNIIDPGASIKHDLFASRRKAEERLPFEFQNKEKLIGLFLELERQRNLLCYGKQQTRKRIEDYLSVFNSIRKTFDELGVKYE